MKKGFFLTFEGTDGVGKSTHAKLIYDWLRQRHKKVLLTREPGGGLLAEKIRSLLLNPSIQMENRTELFLYEAARVEHVEKVIRPALKARQIVICDRFTDATLAYQGTARGLPIKQIRLLNYVATHGLKPDLTIFLDLPPKQALARAARRHPQKRGDRLEQEGLSFQRKVRKGYLRLARLEPKRVRRLVVRENRDDTQRAIRNLLKEKLHL